MDGPKANFIFCISTNGVRTHLSPGSYKSFLMKEKLGQMVFMPFFISSKKIFECVHEILQRALHNIPSWHLLVQSQQRKYQKILGTILLVSLLLTLNRFYTLF